MAATLTVSGATRLLYPCWEVPDAIHASVYRSVFMTYVQQHRDFDRDNFLTALCGLLLAGKSSRYFSRKTLCWSKIQSVKYSLFIMNACAIVQQMHRHRLKEVLDFARFT